MRARSILLSLSLLLTLGSVPALAANLSISGPSSLAVNELGTWTATYSCTCTPAGNCSCELQCGASNQATFKWYVMSADPVSPHQWVGPVRTTTVSTAGKSSVSDSYSTRMYSFDQYLKIRADVTCGSSFSSKTKYVSCENCSGGPGDPV